MKIEISEFISNAALLLALSMLSVHFRYFLLKKYEIRDWLIGLLYGAFAMLAMSTPVVLMEGAIFDGRSIIISLAGFFEPPIVVILAMIVSGIYRALIGGIGVFPGIGSIVISGLIGLVFRYIMKKKNYPITFLNLLIFGLLVHGSLIAWFFTFPRNIALEILNTIALPYVLVFSLTTMLIGLFMYGQQQRLAAEQNLAESEARYRRLVETLQEGIWEVDQNYRTTFVNPSLLEMLGFNESKVMDKSFFSFINPEHRLEMEEILTGRARGKPERVETVFLRKDGSSMNAIAEIAPVFGPDGKYAGFLAGIQDITDRKRDEEKLERYSKELESMVEERTRDLKEAQAQLIAAEKLSTLGELSASVGHELRNPLSVIRNAAYLLKSHTRSEKKIDEYAEIIDTESRTASQIVTDLLDYSRIHPMKSDRIDMRDLVASVLEKAEIPDEIKVNIALPEDFPKALGNKQQITQIIANLVHNAVDAMPEGGDLRFSALERDKMLGIQVSDSGVGISEENLDKIFEPLYTTKKRGVGLGLAISRRLADLNQAEITVESELGKGSRFTLWLQAA